MKVISVIEKNVVLDTIFSVDFTVCTSFESNILNLSILGGKNLVIYCPHTCTIIIFCVTFLIEISIYVVCTSVLKIAHNQM